MTIESECSTDISPSNNVGEDALLASLKESMISPDISSLSRDSCIFKVPQVLRRNNPEAYEPDVVSIGPFHRCRKQLQHMDTVKWWYLRTLLNHMNKSFAEFIDLLHKKGIFEFEKSARSFYAEPLYDLSQIEFIKIMILDSCFIIQLLRNVVTEEKDDDPILKMDCMFQYVCHDLFLLENQLPWFVLSSIYSVTLDSYPGAPRFGRLLFDAFCSQNSLKKYFKYYLQPRNKTGQKVDEESLKKDEESLKKEEEAEEESIEKSALHILDLIRYFIVLEFGPEGKNSEKGLESYIPPVTALSEVGVKFKKGDSDNLLDIKFDNRDLTIPELAVAELTEPLLRNLIAFEQCYHGRSHQITSYAVFMDKLISSDKDIELLCEEKILANWLNVEHGSKFFNSLYIDTTVKEFRYHTLCTQVNEYYQVKWNRHREQFMRNYCSTPWKATALAVAILILGLQLSQFILGFLL